MKVKNIMFSGFAAAIFAGVCGAADAAVQYELTSKSYVDTELAKKQDNLSAGTGIDITNNVVKTTLDLTTFATKTEMSDLGTALNQAIEDAHAKGDYATATELNALKQDVEALQSGSATAENLTALQNRVKTIEDDYAKGTELSAAQLELQNAINNLKTSLEAEDAKMAEDIAENAQAIIDEVAARTSADAQIRTDFAAADVQVLADAKADATSKANAAQAAAEATADAALTAYKTANDTKVNKNAEDIAGINAELETLATSETVTNLTTRVATAEGEIDDLQAADTTIRGEFAAADKALEDAYKAADTTLDGKISANAQAITGEATARANADTALENAYKAADAEVLAGAKKYTDDEIAELNQSLSGTSTNLGALTTRVETAEGEIDDLQAADTTIRGEFAAADKALEDAYKAADTTLDGKISANAQAIADEATARANADTALENAINAEHFVSASGILTTKGGYLVISDGEGNISLNQVAVVNGDGTTDIITGESLQ